MNKPRFIIKAIIAGLIIIGLYQVASELAKHLPDTALPFLFIGYLIGTTITIRSVILSEVK